MGIAHSPRTRRRSLPWKLRAADGRICGVAYSTEPAASLSGKKSQAGANGELILRSVNGYEPLAAATRAALTLLEEAATLTWLPNLERAVSLLRGGLGAEQEEASRAG